MKTKPNPSFLNTCILKDMRSFENLPYMMDEKLNLKPEFYDMVEWDECGNIVKVMGRKLIYVPMIWRLEKKMMASNCHMILIWIKNLPI